MVAKALASITGFIAGLTAGSVGQFAAAQIGEVPLSLHPAVVEGYEQFKREPNRYFFAISEDGNSYGYSFCKDDRCTFTRRRTEAIYSCEKAAKMRCFIYANRDRVEWDGKITVREDASQKTKETPQVAFRDGRLLGVDLQTDTGIVNDLRQKLWIDFLKIASKNKFTYHAAPESKAISVCVSWRWSSGKPDPRIRWAFWRFGVSDPSLARSQSLERCDKWVDRSKLQCTCQVLRINDQLLIDVPARPISGQGMGEGEGGMVPSNTAPKSQISQPCQPDKMIYAGC